ncbi:type IV pilin protein, partial [Vibrio campbellii]
MNRGFTLLELLITLVVLALLLSWAAPSYQSVTE